MAPNLTEFTETLRRPGETYETLFARLRSESRGAPQKASETEDDYLQRLVWNRYQRDYQRNNPEFAHAQREKLRRARAGEPGLSDMAERARRKARRKHDRGRLRLNVAKDSPCVDCGGRFPPEAMNFYHRSGEEKHFMVGGMTSRKRSDVEVEIAKCDILCTNCQRTRAAAETRSRLKERSGNSRKHIQRRANDRATARLAVLKNAPCSDCAHHFPSECMDFDHRPGEEKCFNIGVDRRRCWESIQAEIAKCDLVCANCHRIRTATRVRENLKPRERF